MNPSSPLPAPASSGASAEPIGSWPDNPVLTRVWRDSHVESQHRGTWVLVDASGHVVDGAGGFASPVFARSSVKSLQALPLIETGAAERYRFTDDEIALALASHDGEPCHTERVARVLARLGLQTSHLQCGAHPPGDRETRERMIQAGQPPSALHNNCSGKHAGFLALALHLGVDPERYLDIECESQRLVRKAVEEMAGTAPVELTHSVDGCSAPTFRLPLARLATAIARLANPGGLPPARRAACERMTAAAAAWPELIGGSRNRLCTDLARVSEGGLFGKIGAEAVYVVGVRGRDRGLAVKIDDGSYRGLHALVVSLCERFGFLTAEQVAALDAWREREIRNWAGHAVGRVEVVG